MPIVVIGGGVIGLNTAWSLRRRGHEVIVVEAGTIGKSASAVNTGWVAPSLSHPLGAPGIIKEGMKQMMDKEGALTIRPQTDASWLKWLWKFKQSSKPRAFEKGVKALFHLNARTIELFDQLAEDGVNFEMHKNGILSLALQKGSLDKINQLFALMKPMGFTGKYEFLTGDEVRERDPAVSQAVTEGLFTHIDRYVHPESLLKGLQARLIEMDVPVYENTRVERIQPEGDSWVVHTHAEPIKASRIVIAAGVATNALLAPLKIQLPIIGGKGYSIEVQGTGTAPKQGLYLLESKLALSPFENGVRIAGFFELPSTDETVTRRNVELLAKQAEQYLEGWKPTKSIDIKVGRAGLRPSTPDSLPYLGEFPKYPGLFIAAGHGMLGVTLAPASAEVIADLITEGKNQKELEVFQLAGRV